MDKDSRKLNAISQIDDEIIEKQTQRRIELLRGVKRKQARRRWIITVSSMAASLALVASTVLLLVTLLGKTVPIYTGMSVSDKPPAVAQTTVAHWGSVGEYASASTQPLAAAGDLTGRPAPSFEQSLSDKLLTSAGAKDYYYAEKGQDVYITVHLENPDEFEIVSFTLNGKKYTNYMFEPGSDLENLILKVNVGDAEGLMDYTIDAIKYIDGEDIKDVKMEGDKTVQIGVYSDKQPTATASEESIGFNSISFNVTAADALGLVASCAGKLEAVLFDGTRILATKGLAAGTTAVSFEGLAPNTPYEYALVATYDAFDGEGKVAHILYQKAFYTKAYVLFDTVSVEKDAVSFTLRWASGSNDYGVTAFRLYKNDVMTGDVSTSANRIEGLSPDTAYRLIADYTYGGKTGSIVISFTTEPLVYTVNHVLEDLDGTGYTLEKTESVKLQPGETFAPALLSFEGFTAPAAESKQASLTDENPVIEYRYTRNSYAVAFLGGGTQTNDTLKFGAALPAPTRDGHTFLGWFDVSGEKHVTMPAKALTLTARWSGELTSDDLHYTGSSEITITGLKNLAYTDIILPAYIGNGRVVAIAADAFKNCTSLASVTLPATITQVGGGAFSDCTGLEKVLFDGTLTQWCNIEFQENYNVGFSSSASDMSQPTFYPIERYAANPITQSGNLYLTSAPTVNVLASAITLPTGELNGRFSFAGAPLTELIIPEGATSIPFGVVAGCEDLATIRFNATNMPDFAERDDYDHMLGAGKNGAGVRILIGANVTRIPAGGIFNGAKIAAITFATGSVCTEIGNYAFFSANPNGMGMNFCTEIALPAGLVTIGRLAFSTLKLVTELTIPEGVTTIGDHAFKNMYLPETLTIPASVTSIGKGAFAGLQSLKTLYYNSNAVISGDGDCVFAWMGSKVANGTAVVIGANVTAIPAGLFSRSYDDGTAPNITTLTFATGSVCKEIGTMAFMHCESLSEVVLPEGLERIGVQAFENCSALTTITIPASVTSIDEFTFAWCNALTDVHFGGSMAEWEQLDLHFATTPTIYFGAE